MKLHGKDSDTEIDEETTAALKLRWNTRAVDNELLKMRLWLIRYPTRRPVHIWRFIDNWLRNSPATVKPAVVSAWWTTKERTINQAKAIGVETRPGESWPDLRERIAKKLREAA